MTSYRALFSKLLVGVSLVLMSTSSAHAMTAYDGNAPTAPTNVKATAYTGSPTRVVITWNQAQDNIGVTRYNIYKNGTFMVTPQGVGVTFTDFDVVVGQTYTYSVQAGDGDGNNGPQSDTVQIIAQEGAVSQVVATLQNQLLAASSTNTTTQQVTSFYSSASIKDDALLVNHPENIGMVAYDDKIVITWKNPSGNNFRSVRVIKKESSYPVSVTDGKVICDSLTVTQCVDIDVVQNKTYYYGVYSTNQSYIASKLVLVSGAPTEKKAVVTPIQTGVSILKNSTSQQGVTSTKPASTTPFTKMLKLGTVNQEVLLLQKFLNSHKYVIASTGPGSPGNETSLFGRATERALKAYQCDKKIVCDGSPETTGYGMVGKTTRMNLNQDSSASATR